LTPDDDVVVDGVQRAKVGVKVTPKPGKISAPYPGQSPTPANLSPPAASATFAATAQ
jgi:hypothetical protein